MYALCDQRSFYASCEAVFRPELRNQSIAVLSNNDGCVVALNEKAKAVGVQKFEPYFKQRALMQDMRVNVFSSNYALYGAISDRIMQSLRDYTPALEQYSCDEGFADFSEITKAELKPLSVKLRQVVWREQRIPMGVSVGPTKTLAKLGQYATKKLPQVEGVVVLTHSHQWQWLAKRVPVNEVWGVGRRLTVALHQLGIGTAFQLSELNLDIGRKLGGVTLVRTIKELNGESCIPLELAPPSKQQIICSRSFGEKLKCLSQVEEAVSSFAVRAAEKLRGQESLAGRLSVWVLAKDAYGDRLSDKNSVNLPGGSDDSRRLAREAVSIARSLYKPNKLYLKAGVALMDIRPREYWQPDLLGGEDSSSPALMSAIDLINKKFGRQTVGLGRQAGKQQFAMKQQMLSPRYLTHWQDIPKLSC